MDFDFNIVFGVVKLFDIKVINWEDFFQLLIRFALNLAVTMVRNNFV